MQARWLYVATIAVPIALGSLVLAPAATAQESSPASMPNLLNRIERDLTPSAPTEFFVQGRSRFEREIQRLSQPEPSQPILKISTTPIEQSPEVLRQLFKAPLDRSMIDRLMPSQPTPTDGAMQNVH
ncbi:hypothetical protein ACN4EG_23180 [Alkalinema pantanalense CENA528]|uniref:hypothetical protein n=1 Tax=Alkalinema pantanalense TaxID=1620705 RepID=UPI003D6E3FE7